MYKIKIAQYVALLMLLFSIKIGFGSTHSFGEIDKDFFYEDLVIEEGYLKGTMLNKSASLQKNIRIRFDAYDVFNLYGSNSPQLAAIRSIPTSC